MSSRRLSFLLSFWFVFLSASAARAAGQAALVIVSVRPLALLVQDICQNECKTQALIPLGVSEHHWEPGPKDIRSAKSAVAAVGIGLGLDEAWFSRALPTTKSGGKVVPILVGKDANPLPWKQNDHDANSKTSDHGHDHEHGLTDPHVWFDPVRMAKVVPVIVNGLSAALPQSAKALSANGDQVMKKLAALNEDILTLKRHWRSEPVLMLHDAFGYWAERYAIKTVALSGAGGSDHQISAKVMAKALRDFKKTPPLAIVVEREDGIAKNLARECNVPLVVFDLAASGDKQSYYDWLMRLARDWDGFAKGTSTARN